MTEEDEIMAEEDEIMAEEEVEFIDNVVLFEGYLFYKRPSPPKGPSIKCDCVVSRHKLRCTAKMVISKSGVVLECIGAHNHDPDPKKVELHRKKQRTKDFGKKDSDDSVLTSPSKSVRFSLPTSRSSNSATSEESAVNVDESAENQVDEVVKSPAKKKHKKASKGRVQKKKSPSKRTKTPVPPPPDVPVVENRLSMGDGAAIDENKKLAVTRMCERLNGLLYESPGPIDLRFMARAVEIVNTAIFY